jgi:hypothetical protein
MATYGVTRTSDTEALSQLVAGDVHIQKEINLKISAGALSRGTVLEMVATNGTTWQQLTAGSPTNARAILAEDAANNASTVTKVQAYFVGKYRETDLIWPAAITTLNKRAAITNLADHGIIVEENVADITTTTSSSTTTTTTA